MPALLEVEGLSSGYGPVAVLHEIGVRVEARETVSVLGANGAGKSTLVNTIAGLLRSRRGRVVFDGEDVTGLKPEVLARKGLSLVRQGHSVFPWMTVQENLDLGAWLVPDKARIAERTEAVFTMFPVLKERRGQAAGAMSGGEQKMLEIGRSLLLPLKLLMLDEPSLGLGPKIMDLIFERIREFNRTGLAVLLVEQNAYGALGISSRAYVLELGRIGLEGASATLMTDPQVRERYLGVGPV
jgi:branched-chain amino acid transport system ATP-binding protein